MSASPMSSGMSQDNSTINYSFTGTESGSTKREHFAGLALQGWLARCANVPHTAKLEPASMAEVAVSMADALLKELEKNEN